MEKRYTIFDFLNQVFFIFGVTVTCLLVFVLLFGAGAVGISSIFALAEKGLAVATLGQYLLMSVVITILRFVFFTDVIIKNCPVSLRTIWMFVSVVVMIGAFAACFGWFPIDDAEAWILFFVCFFISCVISVMLSSWKEKKENEKMQEALERMKKGED